MQNTTKRQALPLYYLLWKYRVQRRRREYSLNPKYLILATPFYGELIPGWNGRPRSSVRCAWWWCKPRYRCRGPPSLHECLDPRTADPTTDSLGSPALTSAQGIEGVNCVYGKPVGVTHLANRIKPLKDIRISFVWSERERAHTHTHTIIDCWTRLPLGTQAMMAELPSSSRLSKGSCSLGSTSVATRLER